MQVVRAGMQCIPARFSLLFVAVALSAIANNAVLIFGSLFRSV